MSTISSKLGLVPTVLILIFLIKVVNGQFDDPDFYWHLKTGEYIVAHGGLPQADMFSHTNAGRPWVLHEWLFQVFIYLVHAAAGDWGIRIFVALMLTACFGVCYAICARLLDGDQAKALIVALLYCSIITAVAPRPHLFTFLFFALFLHILLSFKYFGETRRLWLIPPVMVIWVNLHGGFFIGLVLVVLFALGEWMGYWFSGKSDAQARRRLRLLALTGAAAFVATLANPEFIRFWLYPFQVIGMEASKGLIEEWRSPDFHQPIFTYWLLLVGSFIAVMLYVPRRPDPTEFIVPLAFVAGAFIARRNIPLAALAMAPFAAAHLRAGLMDSLRAFPARFRQAHPMATPGKRAGAPLGKLEYAMNAALILLTVVALILIYPERQKTIAASLHRIIPVAAVDFIEREGIEGRMFNTYHYGGYLIHRLYPQQRVFIDGRADMYGDAFIRQALAIYQGSSEWKSLFDRHAVDYVICESEAPLRQLLLQAGTFRLVYDDGMHSVLLRDIEKYRALIGRHERKPVHG